MSGRPTPQAFALATLFAWCLFLGVLCDRLELLVAALPLAMGFLSAACGVRRRRFGLAQTVSGSRLAEGGQVTVHVRLEAADALPIAEILSLVPRQLGVASGNNRTAQTIEAGGSADWSFDLDCPARGRFDLGTALLRLWDRSGLRIVEHRLTQEAEIAVYPGVERLRHVPQPLRTQSSFGNYVSPRVGEGIEPGDLRPFAPGDRVRHINWRATARRGELYVTRFQEERNADVVLLLDALSDSGASPRSSLDLGVRAAAALAHAYLARKDRVGFIEYGGFLRWIGPGTGRRQAEAVAEALLPAATHFSYVAPRLDRLPPRILPANALVIALSPLLDERFTDALADLVARGFDVILVAISPVEVTRRSLAGSTVDDLACRLWALEWRAKLTALKRHGVRAVEWDGVAPLEAVLSGLARTRRGWVGRS
ncbi:MAG TPA: DUF58 domain-containing protein [Stellaceae bacterium]|nr:DUF58 domain-containing protein [Stellaceae bacterium]